MKTSVSPTSRAKPISWVTTTIVMPLVGEVAHDVEHLADELRVERAGRLVEEHQLGLHRERPGDRDALLLAAGELARVGVLAAGEADPVEQSPRLARPPRSCRTPLTRIGASMTLLERGHVREQVEALEDHADLGPLARDLALAQLVAACRRAARSRRARRRPSSRPASIFSRWLMQRRNVDLPEPDGPMRHITSPRADLEVDAVQHLVERRSACGPLRAHHRRRVIVDARCRSTSSAVCRRRAGVANRVPQPSLGASAVLRGARDAAGEVALEVVLADGEHRGHGQVPEARHDQQRDRLA